MELKSDASILAIGVLFLCAVAGIATTIAQRSTIPGKTYDERQEHARGVAAQWGYFSMLGFGVTMWILMDVAHTAFSYELVLRVMVALGIVVFSTIAIWKDAYVELTNSTGRELAPLGLIAVWQWMRFGENLDTFSFDLSDTQSWTRLILAAIPTWLCLVMIIRDVLRRREYASIDD